MKVFLAILSITISFTASAKVFTAGMKSPVELPNGRTGSTQTATYRSVNSLTFNLSAPAAMVIFTTSDLYLKACSASSISKRCPLGEMTTGNQQIVVINNDTKLTVFSEIFKYGLGSGVAFSELTPAQEKFSAKNDLNTTSTLHAVTNVLPAGNYTVHLQLRNDTNPMTVHPKRLTALVIE